MNDFTLHRLERFQEILWIETRFNCHLFFRFMSLPMRECGLKQIAQGHIQEKPLSLPMRECGLKLVPYNESNIFFASLPMRECGLKQSFFEHTHFLNSVTPHAGVWIETDIVLFISTS